jgi:hypothetical protein
MKLKKVEAEIKKRQEAVAAERDKLDDYISELIDLRESCDRAWDALQDARDALSELV